MNQVKSIQPILWSALLLAFLLPSLSQARSVVEQAYQVAERLNEITQRGSQLGWYDKYVVSRSLKKVNHILDSYDQYCRRGSRDPYCDERRLPPTRRGRVDNLCLQAVHHRQPRIPDYEAQLICTDTDTRCVSAVMGVQPYWRSVELVPLCTTLERINHECVIQTVSQRRSWSSFQVKGHCSGQGHGGYRR